MKQYNCTSPEDYENAIKETVQEIALRGLAQSAVQSAFIKGNTLQNILEISSEDSDTAGIHPDAVLKIKLEIDIYPPEGAAHEYKFSLNPAPYRVKLYDPSSLFAGKIRAVLCQDYNNRVKGRDFFDYVWYLQHHYPVNLHHLQKRMEQSGKWDHQHELTSETLKALLYDRFSNIDYESAKSDVSSFLSGSELQGLDLWGPDLRYIHCSTTGLYCIWDTSRFHRYGPSFFLPWIEGSV